MTEMSKDDIETLSANAVEKQLRKNTSILQPL